MSATLEIPPAAVERLEAEPWVRPEAVARARARLAREGECGVIGLFAPFARGGAGGGFEIAQLAQRRFRVVEERGER